MTPEERKLLNDINSKLETFLDVYFRTNFPDKMILTKDLVMRNSRIIVDGTNGLQIAPNANQKLSVFGAIPVVQAAAITTPSGGGTQDAQSRAAIASIITALKNFGITS